MITQPTKAIVPVAGYGTRRLPVAKAVDKCMLPLLNRPVVDYVVQDLIAAGVTDIYFVYSGSSDQLRRYYEPNPRLEAYLTAKGKTDLLAAITPPEGVRFHYVEQDLQDPRYGTTVPVWLCREHIGADEPFFVVMADQAFWRADGGSEAALLLQQVRDRGADGGLVGVEVPWELVSNYGIIAMDEHDRYRHIIEKPAASEAPSNLNNGSLYILPAGSMQVMDRQLAELKSSEYYITDILNELAETGNGLTVRRTDAAYLDCGTVESWVTANSYLLEHSRSTAAARYI